MAEFGNAGKADACISLKPLGYVESPYRTPEQAPRQGFTSDILSKVVVLPEYMAGLDGLEGIEKLVIIYWAHLSKRDALMMVKDGRACGIFSTRSLERPNPIGICTVEVVELEGNILTVRGLDALNKSPVLDIKPYVENPRLR
ncbi:MAG: tRNA (N6-threonylcarbamoyladenosine(37)-N6)-methyltransferase TrmO [Thermoplasmata archaeon HGW-Thermoplasmata-1]|nr:MAG: tRNA (N6-threonylcarbamoyladenosine(37)-N6)-methyltransferase TrmO [Thermoplasmata archaeon HGW-Thermoplasmata-1]